MNTKFPLKSKKIKAICNSALFLICVVGISSCVDEEYDFNKMNNKMEIDPKLALTIGSVNIELGDMLSDFTSSYNLQDSSDGSMKVVYEQDLKSFSAEQKIAIPGQTPIVIPAFIFPSTIPAGGETSRDTTISLPITFLNDQRIDSLLVKTFSLSLSGTSSYPSNIKQILTITFQDMKKQNVKYNEVININSVNVNYVTLDKEKAADYLLKFSSVGSGYSNIPVNIKLTLQGTAGTPINPLSKLDVIFLINELKYKILYGYIGQFELLNNLETIDISFLSREMAKNIYWYNPQISILLKNSYALPVNFNVVSMSVYSDINKQIYNTDPDNTIAINPKDIKHPYSAYQYAQDVIPFSKQGGYGKLFNAIEKYAPQSITYHVIATSNPNGPTVDYNILMDTSSIESKLRFELPIWFRSPGFGTTDTMDFDMFSNDNKDQTTEIESMLFRIVSDNGMPFDMNLQVYFADEKYKKLDSLFNQPGQSSLVVQAGKVDKNTGKVTENSNYKVDMVFTDDQLVKLEKTKKLIYKVTLSTAEYLTNSNPPYVKFLKGNNLKLTFAAQLQPKITITNK
jgi:hypothetical protein